MKESKKASGGKEGVNGENDNINPDNEKEHDEKENKKKKKKRNFQNIKFIPFVRKKARKLKDKWEKITHKKEKSHSNETPPLPPVVEMDAVPYMGKPYETEHDGRPEEVETLLEETEQRNVQDEQNLEDCDNFPATEQFEKLTKFDNDAQASILAQMLVTLAKAMKKEPDVAKMFHLQSQYVIRQAAKDDLKTNDIHFLLDWIKTMYPDFLREKMNDAQLGELLSTDEINDLEDKYIRKLNEDLETWWHNGLKAEEESWEQDPDNLSELSHNIVQMFNSIIKAAKEISEDFGSRVMPMVESELLQLLNRYKSSFKKYHKKNWTKSHFRKIIMANMNYCSHLSDFVNDASTNEDKKQKMHLILQNMEEEGDSILMHDFFQKVECDVKTLSGAKGLTSLEIMRENIFSATEHLSSLSTLSDKCRQGMATRIHMHLVIKYLAEIKDIRQCNRAEQKTLATQMDETAELLIQFCTDHLNDDQQSDAAWANNVIHQIADLIRCEDLETIKLKVGVLAQECPDIRKRHVKSFLCIKNHLWNSQRMSAVEMLDSYSNRIVPKGRRLFTFIPCRPCHCLIL